MPELCDDGSASLPRGRVSLFGNFCFFLFLGVEDPIGEFVFADALIGAEDEAAAFAGYGPHQGYPGVSTVSCGREVEIYVLAVEGMS